MSDEAPFTSRHLTARDYGKLFGLSLGGLLGLTAWILLCPGGVECADLDSLAAWLFCLVGSAMTGLLWFAKQVHRR